MTITDLRNLLRHLPPGLTGKSEVYLASDAEGNGYHRLGEVSSETESGGSPAMIIWPQHDSLDCDHFAKTP